MAYLLGFGGENTKQKQKQTSACDKHATRLHTDCAHNFGTPPKGAGSDYSAHTMLRCYLKMHISVCVQKTSSWFQSESCQEDEELEVELVGSDSSLSEFLHPQTGMHTKSEFREVNMFFCFVLLFFVYLLMRSLSDTVQDGLLTSSSITNVKMKVCLMLCILLGISYPNWNNHCRKWKVHPLKKKKI